VVVALVDLLPGLGEVTGDSTQSLALLFITQAVVVELLQIMEPLLNREALVAVVKAKGLAEVLVK
jgi:hypothetical protein